MSNGYLTNPLVFLVQTLFGLYILVVLLRFLLQCVRADFYNPLSQFLVRATNPLLGPMRRFIPAWGSVDTASIVLLIVLQLLSGLLVAVLSGGYAGIAFLLMYSIAELLTLSINVFLFAILIQVVLSWVNPGAHNPVTSLVYSLTTPLLQPVRRLIPPLSGIDFSPLVVLVGLQVLKMLLIPPLVGHL